jgi:serine/threonine protein kinase
MWVLTPDLPNSGHYEAFRTGKVLHRDLSENNLMVNFVGDEIKGVVNDWDMAKFEGSNDSTSAAHHRTGTPPFMAIDLLAGMAWGHLYRYDLESFFYILLWAAIHYDLKQRKKLRKVHSALKGWISNDMDVNAGAKELFMTSPLSYNGVYAAVRKEFKEIEKNLIKPLHDLFCEAMISRSLALRRGKANYDYVTCGGVLTFHTFMEAINVVPRWAKSNK